MSKHGSSNVPKPEHHSSKKMSRRSSSPSETTQESSRRNMFPSDSNVVQSMMKYAIDEVKLLGRNAFKHLIKVNHNVIEGNLAIPCADVAFRVKVNPKLPSFIAPEGDEEHKRSSKHKSSKHEKRRRRSRSSSSDSSSHSSSSRSRSPIKHEKTTKTHKSHHPSPVVASAPKPQSFVPLDCPPNHPSTSSSISVIQENRNESDGSGTDN